MLFSENGDEVERALRRIERARIEVMVENPIFGYLLSFVKVFPVSRIQTCGVSENGIMIFNPSYINSLSLERLKGLLVHEVVHLALKHIDRRKQRKRANWNLACDIVSERFVQICGYPSNLEDPEIREFIERYEIDVDSSAEMIYERIKHLHIPERIISIIGSDDHDISDKLDSNACPDLGSCSRVDFGKLLEEAAKKGIGSVPGQLERILEYKRRKRRLSLILRKRIVEYVPYDYCWIPPSRRSMQIGLYLPGIEKRPRKICAALDTSGSISDHEYAIFLDCLEEIERELNCEIIAISCDAEVKSVKRIQNLRDLDELRKRTGYGGTDFRPVFEWIERNVRDCRLLIYFTDLMGIFPEKPPRYPVIWIAVRNREFGWMPRWNPPFGELVMLDEPR